MKLRPYNPSPFRHPWRWTLWTLMGRLPAPETPPRPEPIQGPAQSLFLRHLDCGSCNGCELALHAVNTPNYDLAGQGIHFVASPRHADALVMTGPLTYNMLGPALEALAQMPVPRIVALGDCALGKGPFQDAYGVVPFRERPSMLQQAVVQHIPGCPPHPAAILEAMMRFPQSPSDE